MSSFLETRPLYVKKHTPACESITVWGFELPIQLPVRPQNKDIINYGVPKKKQKFYRDRLPTDKEWEGMTDVDKTLFAEQQWHKRLNGDWWFINGNAYYIPGNAWFFFNYWNMSSGGLPDFRMEAVEYMLVDDFVSHHKSFLGKYVVKARRIGETEKELCCLYEEATRYRHSKCGMMNVNEKEAQGNFLRLSSSYKEMRPWFRPHSRGKDPQTALVFDFDEAPKEGEPKRLQCSINFRPTKLRSYDGWKLRRMHWDEIGKIIPSDIDVEKQLDILRECVTLFNGMRKVGTIAATTTVENFGKGATVRVCKKLWKDSDPLQLDSFGRTLSGLVRYYRNYRCTAEVDEFGIHEVEQATANRKERIRQLMAKGDLEKLADYKRKFPDDIEDALSIPEGMCVLHPVLLDMQMVALEQMADRRLENAWDTEAHSYPSAQRGDLVWEDKFMGAVRWVPSDAGKFWISQHPMAPNNRTIVNGKLCPSNTGIYTMGVDPVDHLKGPKGGSDVGMTVFRALDYEAETDLVWVEADHGLEVGNKWAMKTNKYVCTYGYRPVDPRIAYEDALKCAIYYGIPAFIERDKPGMAFYFDTNNAQYYLDWKNPFIKVGAKKEHTTGMKTSQESNQLWVDILKQHIFSFHETYVHRNQLEDMRGFTGENTTECDLTVASGLAIMQAKGLESLNINKGKEAWAFPFETYQT